MYICSFFPMRRSGVDEQAELEAAIKLCPTRVRSELVSRLDPAACHALLCERLEGFAQGRPPIRHKGQDAADPPTWRRVTAAALGAEEGCEPVARVRQWLIGVPQALGGDEEARATADERAAQQRAREPQEEETAPADAAGQRRTAPRGTPPAAPPPAAARAAARRQADEAADAARAAAAEQRADAHSDRLGQLRTEAEAAAAEEADADAELAAAMEAVRAGKARAEDRKAKARQALSALEGAQTSLGAPSSPSRLGEGGGDFAALAAELAEIRRERLRDAETARQREDLLQSQVSELKSLIQGHQSDSDVIELVGDHQQGNEPEEEERRARRLGVLHDRRGTEDHSTPLASLLAGQSLSIDQAGSTGGGGAGGAGAEGGGNAGRRRRGSPLAPHQRSTLSHLGISSGRGAAPQGDGGSAAGHSPVVPLQPPHGPRQQSHISPASPGYRPPASFIGLPGETEQGHLRAVARIVETAGAYSGMSSSTSTSATARATSSERANVVRSILGTIQETSPEMANALTIGGEGWTGISPALAYLICYKLKDGQQHALRLGHFRAESERQSRRSIISMRGTSGFNAETWTYSDVPMLPVNTLGQLNAALQCAVAVLERFSPSLGAALSGWVDAIHRNPGFPCRNHDVEYLDMLTDLNFKRLASNALIATIRLQNVAWTLAQRGAEASLIAVVRSIHIEPGAFDLFSNFNVDRISNLQALALGDFARAEGSRSAEPTWVPLRGSRVLLGPKPLSDFPKGPIGGPSSRKVRLCLDYLLGREECGEGGACPFGLCHGEMSIADRRAWSGHV